MSYEQRKMKLDAIGTLLEKAMIKDAYLPLNAEQNLPEIFVSAKLYGKATEDDPIYIHPKTSAAINAKNRLKTKQEETRKISENTFRLDGGGVEKEDNLYVGQNGLFQYTMSSKRSTQN